MRETRMDGSGVPEHALITGGAGFIGSHLAEALLVRGDSVTVVDNLSTGRFANVVHLVGQPGFRFVEGSAADGELIKNLTRRCDVVYHLAAAVGVELVVDHPLEGIETNVLGTHTVLKAASRQGCKVLIASTSEVYGKSERLPFREDDDVVMGPTAKSRWSYACAKALDEFLGLAYHQNGLQVVIFRLFNTVGPRQTGRYGMVVPRLVRQALGGEKLTVYGTGEQRRCFCDVEDAVRAIVGLADSPDAVGRIFNIGSTEEVTILELARRVLCSVSDLNPGSVPADLGSRVRFVPYDQAYGKGYEDMLRRIPDTSRIRATIGWEPQVTLDETLRRVRRFYDSRSAAAQAAA